MFDATVQMKGFPLAGLLTNVNPENLKKPETAARSLLAIVSTENLIKPNTASVSLLSIIMVQGLAKLSLHFTKPHFGNLSKPDTETVCYYRKLQFWNQTESGIGITHNLTKPDILSAENLAEWLSKAVTENLSKLDMEGAGTLTNVDIESAEMMTNDDMPTLYEDKNGPIIQEFSEAIKKSVATSTRGGLFAPVHARENGFSDVTTREENNSTGWSFRRSTRARGEFLQSIKKGLQSHCPSIYGYRAPAKSGAGIGVPEIITATPDAPSVFFCVVHSVHPFFCVAVIIRAAHEIMVGCVGASFEAPVSVVSGYANPIQSTTLEIGVSGGGYSNNTSEAATWLLPSPKNHLSSGVFIPASNPAISLYLLLLNQKPAPCYPTARACSLPVFVQGALMLNHFIVYGYGVNQRGMTIGINHKTHAESEQSAKAAAMLKARDSGLSLIRITRVREVAA